MSDRSKPAVLVVEPNAANRALICECLAQLPDVRPVPAGSGREALRLCQELAPVLVLLDIPLPDFDGLAVAREIRSREKDAGQPELLAWTPIVFLSADSDEETLAQGILAGGDDYLYKPISEVVLLAKVRAMLRIAAMREALQDAHRTLREISYLDGLTRIPNRRQFDDRLAAEWQRCIRQQAPLSVVIGDVDFFKQFNDHYGHKAGDACLQAVAGGLDESLFRVEDLVARYGGEEFAAILPGTDPDGALAVAERMQRAVRELWIPHARGVAGYVSCSFGVATGLPGPEATHHDLVRLADQALYAAKHAGRDRVMTSCAG